VDLSILTAISPIDGRYREKSLPLDQYFSEYALMKYRVLSEIEYFIALCGIPLPQLKGVNVNQFSALRDVYAKFSIDDAIVIKNIEKGINHDVKAVEYFLREKFDALGLSEYKEFIHFGLTSQDVNNTAVPYSLKEAMLNCYYPLLKKLTDKILSLSEEWKNVSMIARTHGQPASPTRMGKEFYVFYERIIVQLNQLMSIPYSAKFGGATGNFNAHHVAYPQVNWVDFGNHFVNDVLKLHRSQTTTQIEHYDNLSALFDASKRINTILIDLSRDVWTYVSLDYFKQKINDKEVGSSAMPHKVNPIDFENAEGNLAYANAIFEFLSSKLPVSRLQRDLTDSTVLRNIGVPIAHTLIAFSSLLRGLDKLIIHTETIHNDLEKNWAVVAEAIQTILRRENYPDPYNALKNLTRKDSVINKETIQSFITGLDVPELLKNEMRKLSPENYTGV